MWKVFSQKFLLIISCQLNFFLSGARNCIQERPTQINANCVLYIVGGMQTNPVPPQKLEGKDYSSDVIYYSPTKNKLIYQVRVNTYDFWISGQYEKYNNNIFLFHPMGPFPSKKMRCPWILCFDLLPLQYTDLTYEIWRFLVYIFLGLEWLLPITYPLILCMKSEPED